MAGGDTSASTGGQEWQWDVVLSFAGAQREYVEQVAAALKAAGVRCFYDADEQIDLWGKYLAEELPAIYGERAAAVVVFVSAEYAVRDWTRLERRAALARAVRERREYVLPARFDDTPLAGLLPDVVYIDLRRYTPAEFAHLVARKLAALGIRVPAAGSGGSFGRDARGERPPGAIRVAEEFRAQPDGDAGQLNAPRTSPPRDDLVGGTRHFMGRGPEVQMLCSLLTDQAQGTGVVLICAVNGMAGIGKTALANHAAHQVKEEFPDGQLNIDLHGYTVGATPTPADKALEILLSRVGVPKNEIPDEIDERAALWRAKLADKRMLVVLDNARETAQVRPLLPGSAGCGVLITSRDSLASLDDAYPLRLDTLSAHDALILFRRIVGSELVDEHLNAIEQIIALCGYLPLALRIIAARLRAWPEPTMLLDRLQKERARLTQLTDGDRSVLAAFAVSYDSLPSNQQHMFTMLGLVPGTDFDAHAAAAIAGIGLEEARQDLEGLINASLLIADGAGRMHFHDLLREYAHHLGSTAVDPHDQTVAVERLLYSNLAAARAAGKLLPSHEMHVDDYPIDVPASAWEPATEEDARRWLLVERANLTLLVECTQGLASARLGTIVGQDLLELGYTDDARACFEHAGGQFSAIGDRPGQAETEQGLGLTELRFGDYDKAIAHFSKAIHLFHAIADSVGRAHAQCQLGHLYLRLGQHETAAGYFTDADTVFRELGDQIGHAKAQRGLGHIAVNRSRLDEAETHYREADQACLATGDRIGHAHAQRALARVAADQGRLDEASVHYLTADQVYLDVNSRAGHGAAQWGLGHVALRAGRPHDAVRHFTSAREEFRNASDCAYEASAERGLGEVALQCGDYPTALRHFTRAGTIYEQTSDKAGQVTTQQDIARVATTQGDLTAAQRALGKALELSPEGPLADSIQAELDSLSGKVWP